MAYKRTYQQYYADIAKAIRNKGGTGTYRPSQMAAAIRALKVSGMGVLTTFPGSGGYQKYAMTDPKYYSQIAAAIRAKGGTSATYKPSQMAAAIQALIPDPVAKVRLKSYTTSYQWLGLRIHGTLTGASVGYSAVGGYVAAELTNVTPGTWQVYAGASASANSCIGTVTVPADYTGSPVEIIV